MATGERRKSRWLLVIVPILVLVAWWLANIFGGAALGTP